MAKATFKQRRDTAQNWSLNNPVLHEGEIGIATDVTGFKVGDGVSTWSELPYFYKKGYSQKTKLGCQAGATFSIEMESSPAFLYAPLEVLKFAPSELGKIVTLCSFDNADSGSFSFSSGKVVFDGVMKLNHATEELTFSAPTSFVNGYICSASVDLANYKELLEYKCPEYVKLANISGTALINNSWETYSEEHSVSKTSLYVKENTAYGVVDGTFSALTTTWNALTDSAKVALFESTTGEASVENLKSLGTFTIYSYSVESTAPQYSLVYLPFPQLILPTGTISLANFELSNAEITYSVTGSSSIKIAVTKDLETYYTYNAVSGEFEQIAGALTAEKLMTQGINVSDLASIPKTAWESMELNTIGFAYVLSQEEATELCYTDELRITVDANGAWKKAIHGTDYDYLYDENSNAVFSVLTAGDYKINFMS